MATAVLESVSAEQKPISANGSRVEPSATQETAGISRKLWTRAEYRRLIKAGYLTDGGYELVLGEVWEKMGHGRRHIAACTRLMIALGRILDPFRLQSQASLPVAKDGDPEPDLAVLADVMDNYLEREPRPDEILLIVEVSDSTLRADLSLKARQYGSAGIPEYWVVDIPNRLLHVFREPTADGYASETILTIADEVRPLAAPDAIVRVAELLP